jgi:hypothetical protein
VFAQKNSCYRILSIGQEVALTREMLRDDAFWAITFDIPPYDMSIMVNEGGCKRRGIDEREYLYQHMVSAVNYGITLKLIASNIKKTSHCSGRYLALAIGLITRGRMYLQTG